MNARPHPRAWRARASAVALLCSAVCVLTGLPASADAPRAHRLSRADEVYLRREASMAGLPALPPPSTRGATLPDGEPPAVSEARRQAALQALERSGAVRRCWTAHLLRFPTALSRRLPVTVHLDATGRVTAIDVRDNDAPELAACIARAGVSVTPLGPGEAMDAETTLALDRGD